MDRLDHVSLSLILLEGCLFELRTMAQTGPSFLLEGHGVCMFLFTTLLDSSPRENDTGLRTIKLACFKVVPFADNLLLTLEVRLSRKGYFCIETEYLTPLLNQLLCPLAVVKDLAKVVVILRLQLENSIVESVHVDFDLLAGVADLPDVDVEVEQGGWLWLGHWPWLRGKADESCVCRFLTDLNARFWSFILRRFGVRNWWGCQILFNCGPSVYFQIVRYQGCSGPSSQNLMQPIKLIRRVIDSLGAGLYWDIPSASLISRPRRLILRQQILLIEIDSHVWFHLYRLRSLHELLYVDPVQEQRALFILFCTHFQPIIRGVPLVASIVSGIGCWCLAHGWAWPAPRHYHGHNTCEELSILWIVKFVAAALFAAPGVLLQNRLDHLRISSVDKRTFWFTMLTFMLLCLHQLRVKPWSGLLFLDGLTH